MNPFYSPMAEGGPTFASEIISSSKSGVESINVGRDQAKARYTIDFSLLPPERKAELYRFFMVMRGMGYGFRFLAPDAESSLLEGELVATTTGGVTTYSLIKTYTVQSEYTGESWTYVRRVTKPALRTMYFTLGDQDIQVQPPDTLFGDTLFGETEFGGFGGASNTLALDYTTGIVTFGADPGGGLELRARGQFHLPVRFETDAFSVRHDVNINEWSGIGLVELMPATLGIT